MNIAQITHIFWKEYRTQRSIWLGVLVLIVMIQLMIGFSLHDGQSSLFQFLFAIGAILSMLYASASAGVMFSGEHEEKTYGWLRTLPVARVPLFTGKLLWLLFSWMVVVLVIALVACLPDYWNVRGMSGVSLDYSTSYGHQIIYDSMKLVSGFLLWGFFFSLICRRVYTALILSAVAFLLSLMILVTAPQWYLVMMGPLFVATVIQGGRWLSLNPMLENLKFHLPGQAWTLDQALGFRADVSSFSRTIRRQIWLEWQHARWIAFGLALGPGLAMFALNQRAAFSFNCILLLGIAPLVCGLGTVRGEQIHASYRFQTNLGVSPSLLWCAKHLVWAGLYLSLLAVYVSILYLWANTSNEGVRMLSDLMDGRPRDTHLKQYVESPGLVVWLGLSFTFFVYAASHVSSLLIKRSTAAGLVAVMVTWIAAFLVRLFLLLDVSLMITFVFPAALLMAFAFVSTSGWLTDRNEPRDVRRRIGALCLIGMVCLTSGVVWRVSELIDLSPFQSNPFFSQLNTTIYALAPITIYLAAFSIGELAWDGCVALIILAIYGTVLWRCKTWNGVLLGWGVIHVLAGLTFVTVFLGLSSAHDKSLTSQPDLWETPSPEAQRTRRLYQNVRVTLGSVPNWDQPGEARKVSDLFAGKWELSDEQKEWLDQNETERQKLLIIAARDESLPDYWGLYESRTRIETVVPLNSQWKARELLLRLGALRAEQDSKLKAAWADYRASLQMIRHRLQWNFPIERANRSRILTGPTGLQLDLHRWINHPDQTPDLLQQAAEEMHELFSDMPSLSDAYQQQARVQSKALLEDGVNKSEQWKPFIFNRSVPPEDYDRSLLRLIHKLPWESRRAVFLTNETNSFLFKAAEAIEQGDELQYGEEIAASMTGLEFHTYDVVPIWKQELSRSNLRRIENRWRLAETTPLMMAAHESPVRLYGTNPIGAAPELIEEVNFVRQRRLLSLHLAFRIFALSHHTPLEGNWSDQINEMRWDSLAEPVLDQAEKLEGNHPSHRGESVPDLRKHLLYYDPVSGELFAQSTINHWGN